MRSSLCGCLDVLQIRKTEVLEIWEAHWAFELVLTEDWDAFSVCRWLSVYSRAFFKKLSFSTVTSPDIFLILFSMLGNLFFYLQKSRVARLYQIFWSLLLHTNWPNVQLLLFFVRFLQHLLPVVGTFSSVLPLWHNFKQFFSFLVLWNSRFRNKSRFLTICWCITVTWKPKTNKKR